MRKALIAVAVATALFAVGAFAASFAVQSEDSASGSNPVQSCADAATVTFNEDFDEGTNNWNVASVTVVLTAAADCLNAEAQLVLQDNDGAETIVLDQTQTVDAGEISGGVATLTYTPSGTLAVGDVWNAAVLIDGLQISST